MASQDLPPNEPNTQTNPNQLIIMDHTTQNDISKALPFSPPMKSPKQNIGFKGFPKNCHMLASKEVGRLIGNPWHQVPSVYSDGNGFLATFRAKSGISETSENTRLSYGVASHLWKAVQSLNATPSEAAAH